MLPILAVPMGLEVCLELPPLVVELYKPPAVAVAAEAVAVVVAALGRPPWWGIGSRCKSF